MRSSSQQGKKSSGTSTAKHDLYNARALLTCYTKAKPRPSKWDDAHKWLSRAPDDGGRQLSSGADDGLLLPSASSRKGIRRPSWRSAGGDVQPAAVLGEQDEMRAKKRVSERQIRCVPLALSSASLRDVGTEMTPGGSKEPSRANTPRAHVRVPVTSPRRQRDGGSGRGGGSGAVSLSAARGNADHQGRDAAAGAGMPMAASASPATAWEEAERAKHVARYRREELKIQARENRARRKAQLQMNKAEVEAERRMRRAQEKAAGKLAATQAVAKERRARAEAKLDRRVAMIRGETGLLGSGRRPGLQSSLLSLKLPLMCS